jgi:O-antigen/teichoic acid export membrane protein
MMGFGAWSLAFMYVGSMAFSTSVLWLSRDVRPSWGCQWQALRELLHFGAPNMVSQMMLIANARLFVLIAGLYLDEFALGKLSLAFRVVEECRNTLSSAASLVALPLLTRRATFPAEFTKVFSEATSFTACILMPIYTGLTVTASDWLTVAFGNKWQNAATTVQILAITALLLTLRQYANIALDAIGRPAMNMLINGLAFTFSVVLLIGASSTHPEAVAGVWALRAVLLSAASLLGVARAVNVTCRAQLQSVMPPFLAALMMGLCVMFLNGTVLVAQLPGIRLTIGIVSGVLIYISMLTIFSPQLFRRFLKFLFATIKT